MEINQEMELPKLKADIVMQAKNKYHADLDKLINIGKSNITVLEAIDELANHLDNTNLVKLSESPKPFTEVVDDLVMQAKKGYNLVIIDKIKLRNEGESSFSIEDIATSINPTFGLENAYVRFFIEYLTSLLNRCQNIKEIEELVSRVLKAISTKCLEVISKVNMMLEEYANKISIISDTEYVRSV